ncbi:MAG: hypothetical protein OEV42_21485 [Deltaproteobacteria bacterium]|nr:hypothetical protein [Deltaproteobacteria bacterium]
MLDLISKNVARLDGYLAGVASVDGNIRSYSSFAYLIELNDDRFDHALSRYYSNQGKLSFSYTKLLSEGLRTLEIELRNYILRDVLCMSSNEGIIHFDKAIIDRKKYISFRVMDLVEEVIEYDKTRAIYKAEGKIEKSKSHCIFYGVQGAQCCLVLQFNDDRDNYNENTIIR